MLWSFGQPAWWASLRRSGKGTGVASDRTLLSQPTWRRSSRCVTEHHCVEFTLLGDQVALRNSQRPADVLLIAPGGWRDLVAAIKDGCFAPPGSVG
ncbi:DUF397 domain-containing protein [Plantactinospora sp. WMMB334]|uniref:DUF397 domain-containing protein n=1 Tax=Plantactinospora sp. WMMB334 TaxID=3404119 RepID=UPI003B93E610